MNSKETMCRLTKIRHVMLLLAFAGIVFGQSAPSITVITNAAIPAMDLHVPTRLQARSMATIFGTNLSSSTALATPPWVKSLGGTEVHLVPLYTDCGTANSPANASCELVADLIYVSATQINFVVPDVSPSAYGQQELALKVIFVASDQRFDGSLSFYISPTGDFAVFGVGYDCEFALSQLHPDACGYSQTPGEDKVGIGAVTDASGQLVTSANPAHQGQLVSMWATGLNGLSLEVATGLMQQKNPASITFGISQAKQNGGFNVLFSDWKKQTPLWAGESPQYVGLDQINVTLPVCNGAPGGTEQRYDVSLSFHAPSADKNLGIGFTTLYMPFVVSPGEPMCQFGAATTTTLSSNTNPSVAGQSLILTAVVNPADATGTVTFLDGTSTLGVGTLVNGKAMCGTNNECSTSGLGVGSHSIQATYNGDSTYASSSDTLLQSITLNTTVTLTSSANPTDLGQSVTFTATISPCCIATGTVTFSDGASILDSAPLVYLPSNTIIKATISTSGLSAGTHSILARYSGDTKSNPSTSATITQTIKQKSITTITSSLNPSVSGQSVTFSITVVPSDATGTVNIMDGGSAVASNVALSSAKAYSIPLLQGSHVMTAVYNGDGRYSSSRSAALIQTVTAPVSTYTYTGNPFSIFSGSISSGRVTMSLTFDAPLASNLTNAFMTPSTWTVGNGITTLSSSDGKSSFIGTFWTDASAKLIGWNLSGYNNTGLVINSCYIAFQCNQDFTRQTAANASIVYEAENFAPGTWTQR